MWKDPQEPAVDEAQATFELLKRAPILYMKQTDEEKARLLKTLLSSCWMRGERLEPVYKKPFNLVVHGAETGDWYPLVNYFRIPQTESVLGSPHIQVG